MNNLSGPCMLMHMVYSVAVSGATGYAGGEVLRLLAGNPNFSVTTVCGHSTVVVSWGKNSRTCAPIPT